MVLKQEEVRINDEIDMEKLARELAKRNNSGQRKVAGTTEEAVKRANLELVDR